MYYNLSFVEVNDIGRRQIEVFEYWARNLLHYKLTSVYGSDYLNYKTNEENYLFKSEIRKKINRLLTNRPNEFTRQVDAFFIEDIIYTLCKNELYNELFKEVLTYSFPSSRESTLFYFNQLIEPRNKLAHSNPISIRELEKLTCYINDFVESVKKYYFMKGYERMWNVPTIITIKDSLGNQFHPNPDDDVSAFFISDTHQFSVGDVYKVSIDIDPTFSVDDYDVIWRFARGKSESSNEFTINFTEDHIGISNQLTCQVISKKAWHKHNSFDDRFFMYLTVLPNEQ